MRTPSGRAFLPRLTAWRLCCSIGALLGLATNQIQERLYAKNVATRGPEARLYLPMFAAVLFPVGVFIFAWCTYSRVSWVALAIGIVVRPLDPPTLRAAG